jgi:flagellar assembly protein FliH
MSSKVLPGSGGARIEQPAWRQVGASSRNSATGGATDETSYLRNRIAELERSLPVAAEQGRSEGRRSLEADAARAEAQLRDDLTRRLANNVADLVVVRGEMRRQMEEDLVRLAIVVARRVVRRELSVDPDALVGIARAAIEQLEAREVHRLRVAPKDADTMRGLLAELGLPVKIAVTPDTGLESGSLVFETARGTVDASVDVQLAEIDRGLADVVRRIG